MNKKNLQWNSATKTNPIRNQQSGHNGWSKHWN